MRNLKSRTMAILIVAILTVSISTPLILVPSAIAHTPAWQILTSSFIHVAPDPAGLGQTVTVGFWVNQPPPTASGPYGDRFGNITVKMTLPDGTTQTLGPFTTDDTGGTYTTITPTKLGTYTFQMIFAGWTLTDANPRPGASPSAFKGDYFMPSNSAVVDLTVQQEPVPDVQTAPLPTTYWQTPINAMNVHNWYPLAGASLIVTGYSTSSGALYNISSNYNPYTEAPQTPHIIWTKPVAFGGVLGGQFGGSTTYGNYYSTEQYEHKFEQIVMNGFLYYTQFPGSSSNPVGNTCVDLRTGQIVWTNDATNYGGGSPAQSALTSNGLVTPLYYGQINDYVSPNQYGGIAYLWTIGNLAGINTATGTTMFNMFDAMTGKYVLSVVNGTTMSMTMDDHGNLIGYYVNSTVTNAPTLNKWNSTQCIVEGTNGAAAWQWRPTQNAQISFSRGLMWSKPLATNISGNALPSTLSIRNNDGDNIVLNSYAPGSGSFQGGWGIFAGYKASTGEQIWIQNITTTPFAGDVNTGASACGNGVFTISLKSTFEMSGYSMTTGEKLWTTPLRGYNGAMPDAYSTAGGYCEIIAGNSIYYAGMGGDIWSLDVRTGKVNWYTNTTTLQGDAGTATPYGIWPLWTFAIGEVADGLLFLSEGHEYSPPLFIGAKQLAINTTTGELVWAIDSFNVDSHPITAYGVMTDLNAYDNQIYAYAKGPSKITVDAPSVGVTTTTPVTITGTITDISAGSQQPAVALNYPNGLPCVSDASMSQWMETVYMQQPMANNITGVHVTLSVVDANGNYRTIGTTTSNIYGTYSYNWKPDISGSYILVADFGGSESYYPSSASTAFYASEPAATPTSAPIVTSTPTEMYFAFSTAAIIIAIVIVGAVLALLVRKRP
ncbi:MAG: PQQ-binding-like beta-propeller repeat protein [Bacillota bacterium]